MPIYDYHCLDCDSTFEERRSMFEEGQIRCPECNSENTLKLISAPTSVLDWKDSDSVHQSIRFRPKVLHPSLRGRSS